MNSLDDSENGLESSLDVEQLAAVRATDRAIAVLAGPGSGKTRALSFRGRHLLLADPAANALLLTFTNKAAAEMKARALSVAGLPSRRIQASTFHTFCADVLRSHADLLGMSKDFEILPSEDSKDLAKTVAKANGLADELRRWSDVRLRRLDIPAGLLPFGCAYQDAKKAARVMDFDDLVVFAAQLLEERADVATAYGAKYRHILVDEFQDTNAAQMAVVYAISRGAQTISIFADDDQAIFGFAGAESENVRRFIESVGAKVYPLTVNYRSGEVIVAAANRLIATNPSSSGRQMRAHRAGGIVRLLTSPSHEQEAATVATEIAGAVSSGMATSEIAVLVRSGWRADLILRQLRARGLPVSDWRGFNEGTSDRRLLAACLAVVRGTMTKGQAQTLCALMGVADSGISGTDEFLKFHQAQPLVEGLREVRRLAFEGVSPHQIARAAQVAVAAQNGERAVGLVSVVEAVGHFELYDKDFTLEHLLAELALGSIGQAPTEGGGIKVASLHRTKGLQWRVVYLVGLEESHLPDRRASTPSELAEEKRLCFVGVSRAQEQLVLTFAATVSGYQKVRSRFLGDLQVLA